MPTARGQCPHQYPRKVFPHKLHGSAGQSTGHLAVPLCSLLHRLRQDTFDALVVEKKNSSSSNNVGDSYPSKKEEFTESFRYASSTFALRAHEQANVSEVLC